MIYNMKKTIKKYLDSEGFYNLMQTYRHAPGSDQEWVIEAFEEVKSYIIKMVEELK